MVSESPDFHSFTRVNLERLMKNNLNLLFNLLLGSEPFYNTIKAGVGNSSGLASIGLILDYKL